MAGKVIFPVLRLALGGIFLVAGVMKIWDFSHGVSATPAFYEDIVNYHLNELGPVVAIAERLPGSTQALLSDLTMVVAVYLPWLEVVIGAALLARRWSAGAAAIAAFLTVFFLAALVSAWSRNLDISCGCFGHENVAVNFPQLLARDGVLLLAALAVTWWEGCGYGNTRTLTREPEPSTMSNA